MEVTGKAKMNSIKGFANRVFQGICKRSIYAPNWYAVVYKNDFEGWGPENQRIFDEASLYLDFNVIITNLDLVDDEQKKILVSNIKSKILELKELLNERQSHRQHIPNVGKQMFKQQLALVETLEKWIIDFENSLKGQN